MNSKALFSVGTESFRGIIESGAYYVDKTAYLQDIFMGRNDDQNLLFTRPRRFGKTLNQSMIKEFCELNYQNPGDKSKQQQLFVDNGRNLAVAGPEYQELRDKVMGEYPVISLSFRGVEGLNFASAVQSLTLMIRDVYAKFSFLMQSPNQSEEDKLNFRDTLNFCQTKFKKIGLHPDALTEAVSICSTFLPLLASMLHQEYERKVLVLIDEYDVPLQKAVVAEEPYYSKMLEIIRKLSVTTFKQNADPWLYKGIVTGCLKLAHQSVFTDANNFTRYDLRTEPYTGFFGFTEEETHKLLCDCGLADRESVVREWYDGYRFGKRKIYCPWSLINYCQMVKNDPQRTPESFWINTSGNDIISLFAKNSIAAHDAGNLELLQQLLNKQPVTLNLKDFATYPDIAHELDFDSFMTLMLHTGYITYAEQSYQDDQVRIRIPNLEILKCFSQKAQELYGKNNPVWFAQAKKLLDLLMANKINEAKELINKLLGEFLSVRNSGTEAYYHGFMLGVLGLAASSSQIILTEEHESGDGYTDITLTNTKDLAVILEFKKAENNEKSRLLQSQVATEQILKKNYVAHFKELGCTTIYGIGIGFGGKNCEITALGNLAKNRTP